MEGAMAERTRQQPRPQGDSDSRAPGRGCRSLKLAAPKAEGAEVCLRMAAAAAGVRPGVCSMEPDLPYFILKAAAICFLDS